ncbi:MAG: hypothetical protein MJ158_03395 [Alphaproteobacteria bacterium]|nr:hypothetical protein [Alphaproteobacteria bacterium]
MKNAKIFSTVMMGVMASSVALAEEPQQTPTPEPTPLISSTNLVTKTYVDDGLRYVYGKTQDNASDITEITEDITNIQETIGIQGDGESVESTGLYKAIEDNRGPEYSAGTGINITEDNEIKIDTDFVATKEDLADIEAGVVNYNGSDGVAVDNGTIKLDGVTNTGTYVYQDGAWQQVEISDTFSTDIFSE